MRYTKCDPVTDECNTLTVEYTLTAGEESSRRGHPDNWYEGSAPELELISVKDESGKEVLAELDLETVEKIEGLCWHEATTQAREYNEYY